jgi:hypothetical protein
VALDGNWTDSAECGYQIAGVRILLANNMADSTRTGIRISEGSDLRIFNNSLLRCTQEGMVLGEKVESALILNNLVQADERHLGLEGRYPPAAVWADYNV